MQNVSLKSVYCIAQTDAHYGPWCGLDNCAFNKRSHMGCFVIRKLVKVV